VADEVASKEKVAGAMFGGTDFVLISDEEV
jgi:hypothetical protein